MNLLEIANCGLCGAECHIDDLRIFEGDELCPRCYAGGLSSAGLTDDYENATEFLSVAIGGGSAGVNVRTDSDGRGFIWWTDFVANDWLEVFPSLAMALGRLALLVACSADDWARMFAGDSADFVATWADFEDKNLV